MAKLTSPYASDYEEDNKKKAKKKALQDVIGISSTPPQDNFATLNPSETKDELERQARQNELTSGQLSKEERDEFFQEEYGSEPVYELEESPDPQQVTMGEAEESVSVDGGPGRTDTVYSDNIIVPEFDESGMVVVDGAPLTGDSSGYLDEEYMEAIRQLLNPVDTDALKQQTRDEYEAAMAQARADQAVQAAWGGLGLTGGQLAAAGDLERAGARELAGQLLGIDEAARQEQLQRLGLAGQFFEAEAGRDFAGEQAELDRYLELFGQLTEQQMMALALKQIDPNIDLGEALNAAWASLPEELKAGFGEVEFEEGAGQGDIPPVDNTASENPLSPDTQVLTSPPGPNSGLTLVQARRSVDGGEMIYHYYDEQGNHYIYKEKVKRDLGAVVSDKVQRLFEENPFE